jgi:hypothetical protein
MIDRQVINAAAVSARSDLRISNHECATTETLPEGMDKNLTLPLAGWSSLGGSTDEDNWWP